jgi:hypothetical protein
MRQIMGLAAAIGITTLCFMALALSPAFGDASANPPAGQAVVAAD